MPISWFHPCRYRYGTDAEMGSWDIFSRYPMPNQSIPTYLFL